MSYLIAVATSDAKVVDLGFGAAKGFHIYEVDGTEYKEKEYREFAEEDTAEQAAEGCGQDGQGSGCGGQTAGCGGNSGGGCGGAGGASKKVELIADCRSLVCQKIGFQAQKQLEKKAIAGFNVDCSVDEALAKSAAYIDKIDNHISLRRE